MTSAWSKQSFIDNGRERKAALIVLEIDDYFRPLGQLDSVVISTVEAWTDQDWEGIAGMAKVKTPSRETRAIVLQLLRARAERRRRRA